MNVISQGDGRTQKLTRREPGPVAIQKGLDALLAGIRARHPGYTWTVVQEPEILRQAKEGETDER